MLYSNTYATTHFLLFCAHRALAEQRKYARPAERLKEVALLAASIHPSSTIQRSKLSFSRHLIMPHTLTI